MTTTTSDNKYSYNLEKLHENILIRDGKKRKKNLDKITILQIFVKRRRPIRYNVVSSRDSQALYYILIKATGFRLSPSLDYNFKYYANHGDCIKQMRKMTNKAMNKNNFKFVADSSYLRIKSLEIISPHLAHHSTDSSKARQLSLARAHAPRAASLASDYIDAISPPALLENEEDDTKIVRIL